MSHTQELEALDPLESSIKHKVDALTPHKIAVVILIQQYLKVKQKGVDCGVSYPAQSRRKFCMVLLKLIQLPDMSYKDLHNTLMSDTYRIDPAHLTRFEKCMTDLVMLGIENLFDLFDTQSAMEKILSENSGVSQYGVVGLYIRRVAVTLDRMTFPEMMTLHRSIILYYGNGVRALGVCHNNRSVDYSQLGINLNKERNHNSKWSVRQAELFIFQQSSLLENNQLQALPPMDLQNKINEIDDDNPLLSQTHFLSYMNYLRLRDFPSSMDVLHRTFDRNPVQTLTPSETKGFQHSSLNLTIFHSLMGHKAIAELCLQECITLSQQAGDKNCLEHVNSWQCILCSDCVKPTEKYISDGTDLVMVSPASLSIQFSVKMAAICGYKPSATFDVLLKSDDLNCRNAILELAIGSIAERASIWTLYGMNEVGSLYAQLLLKLNKIWMLVDTGNTEAVCQVLCMFALWLSTQAEYALSAVVLYRASCRFPRDPTSRPWMICDCCVTITQAIHELKWHKGFQSCCQLNLVGFDNSALQRASVLIARGNLLSAEQVLDKMLQKQNLEPLTYIRALALLAYTQVPSTRMQSQVIHVLTTALKYAKDKFLHYEVSTANFISAFILLRMEMVQKAFCTIEACLEHIYSNGSVYDKARASILFVKCLVANITKQKDKIEKISDSMKMIIEAILIYKKLQAHSKVKDVYVYLATFYHDVDMRNDRNKYAFKFRQYDQQFPTPVEYLDAHF